MKFQVSMFLDVASSPHRYSTFTLDHPIPGDLSLEASRPFVVALDRLLSSIAAGDKFARLSVIAIPESEASAK